MLERSYTIVLLPGEIGIQPREPAREPAVFIAFHRRVVDAPLERLPRGLDEILQRRAAVTHVLQNLQQAPALAIVALRGRGALALEIYVVDQGIEAVGDFRIGKR